MGCDALDSVLDANRLISIHASRMGCDQILTQLQTQIRISIHASRMGCDLANGVVVNNFIFQSTHPVWDATQIFERLGQAQYISIHASRMGCDVTTSWTTIPHFHFNPRIPYGMRRWWWRASMRCSVFQSTHPVWDATGRFRQTYRYRVISIHASRMGCDFIAHRWLHSLEPFQSTHPVWDATGAACSAICPPP